MAEPGKREFLTEEVRQSMVNARLRDVLNEYGGGVDMMLLLQIMLDAMNAKLTAGDVAAIYSYRCQSRDRKDG
jgi:hypothetical protein